MGRLYTYTNPGNQARGLESSSEEMHNGQSDLPCYEINTMYDNQLIDGTLIDIGGVILMYQDPISLASARPVSLLRPLHHSRTSYSFTR